MTRGSAEHGTTLWRVYAPPERRLHARIQSQDAVLANNLPHNVDGTIVGTRQGFVL